jgi:hypothetical protein
MHDGFLLCEFVSKNPPFISIKIVLIRRRDFSADSGLVPKNGLRAMKDSLGL